MTWLPSKYVLGFQTAQPYKSAFDEMDSGAQLSVFGARGTDFVVKERKLNPQDYGSLGFAPAAFLFFSYIHVCHHVCISKGGYVVELHDIT